MKRMIALFCILLSFACLFGCAKNGGSTEDIDKELPEKIAAQYEGEEEFKDTQTAAEIETIIKEKTFYIGGVKFAFSSFEDNQKRSQNFGDGMIDVYVKDGELKKFVVFSEDSSFSAQYNAQGQRTGSTKSDFDYYGNPVLVSSFDGDGNLTGFYRAEYGDNFLITEKAEYGADKTLKSVTKFYYDKNNQLIKQAIYGPDMKLIEVKE